MKTQLKKILPFVIASLLVTGLWRVFTLTGNYAWFPKGKELVVLDIALNSIFLYKTAFWLVTVNFIVFGLLKWNGRKYRTGGIVIAITLVYHFTVGQVVDKKCAFHYYTVFQNQSVTESYIVEPIALAGNEIGPILTEKIEDKEMKYRLYAMLGLKNLSYEHATSIMVKILQDSTESIYYRANAYEFLQAIETTASKLIIKNFQSSASDSITIEVVRLGEYFNKKIQ